MKIRLLHALLPVVAALLSACANTAGGAQTAATQPVAAAPDVTFASALQDLPERDTITTLLTTDNTATDKVVRRRTYLSAAGQTCSMLELINQAASANSLVACQRAQGGWHVRPAYGDMDVSIKIPPRTDAPRQTLASAGTVPAAQRIVDIQQPVMTQASMQQALMEPVAPQTDTAQPLHMSPAPDAPAVTMPADWPTPASLIRREFTPPQNNDAEKTETSDTLWQPRRSHAVTLASALRPSPAIGKENDPHVARIRIGTGY